MRCGLRGAALAARRGGTPCAGPLGPPGRARFWGSEALSRDHPLNASQESTVAPGDLLPGRWFDGRSSQARPVLVVEGHGPGPSLHLGYPLSAPGAAPGGVWPTRTWAGPRFGMRAAPRHAWWWTCAITAAWKSTPCHCLARGPGRSGRARLLAWPSAYRRWSVLLAVLLAAAIGPDPVLPLRHAMDGHAAHALGARGLEAALADQTCNRMDDGVNKPSKLPPERQAQLRARF